MALLNCRTVTIAFCWLVLFPTFGADWKSEVVEVKYTTNTSLLELSVRPDNIGGLLMTWSEAGTTATQGKVQRLDPTGSPLWGSAGTYIADATLEAQTDLSVVPFESGGAIVAWLSSYLQEFISCQKIDSTGKLLWGPAGKVVRKKEYNNPNFVAAVSDNADGAILAWESYSPGTGLGIVMQRINSAGQLLWGASGVSIPNSKGRFYGVVSDGQGGAILQWKPNSPEGRGYLQRISGAGTMQWASGGIPICTQNTSQTDVSIEPDGKGGCYAAWADNRSGSTAIYAQWITKDGTYGWESGGIAVTSSLAAQNAPQISSTLTGIYVGWSEAESILKAQKISLGGDLLWGTVGKTICANDGFHGSLCLANSNDGSAYFGWIDGRRPTPTTYERRVYVQKLTASGELVFPVDGILMDTDARNVERLASAELSGGGVAFVWVDYSVTDHIYTRAFPGAKPPAAARLWENYR